MDSQNYEELHGSKNWDGLLEFPFDKGLRSLILGYGDLCSAAERAFNADEGSKYCGYSHYGKNLFFKGVMLPWADSKYQVTSFIYATASIEPNLSGLLIPRSSSTGAFESNWMGYIAVSNDEFSKSIGHREICVVWRGTVRLFEWMDDIAGAMPVPAEPLMFPPHHQNGGSTTTTSIGATLVPAVPIMLPLNHQNGGSTTTTSIDIPHVMGGWLTIYNTSDPNSEFLKTSARTQLLGKINELLVKYKNEKISITCTGHSLGGCLATLSAFDIALNVAKPHGINVSAFVFESPQVGNAAFKAKMEELPNLKVLRVKNVDDLIPFWPSKTLKWIHEKISWVPMASELLEYVDVGIEILIDTKNSPYLKDQSWLNVAGLNITGMLHPLVPHNLEGILHTLSGWNGKNGEFDWSLEKRDLGLVNMTTDFLKEEFKIPGSWWVNKKNKGMVLKDNGHWVLSTLIDLDDHDLPIY